MYAHRTQLSDWTMLVVWKAIQKIKKGGTGRFFGNRFGPLAAGEKWRKSSFLHGEATLPHCSTIRKPVNFLLSPSFNICLSALFLGSFKLLPSLSRFCTLTLHLPYPTHFTGLEQLRCRGFDMEKHAFHLIKYACTSWFFVVVLSMHIKVCHM